MQQYQKGTQVIYHSVPVELPFDVNVDNRSSYEDIGFSYLSGAQMKVYHHSDGKKYVVNCSKELDDFFRAQEKEYIAQNGYPMYLLPKGSCVLLGMDTPISTKEDYNLMIFYNQFPDEVFKNQENQKGDGYLHISDEDETQRYEMKLWDEQREDIYNEEAHQKRVLDSLFCL